MSGVTVVVPHWNRRNLLESLLKHLRQQVHPILSVVVVDNGSDDGSADCAEESGARVLRLPSNQGFSRAVNAGLATVKTEYVAILNNDVLPEPDWLHFLIGALEAAGEQAWFACGKLYAPGGTTRLDGSFDLLSRSGCAWRAASGRDDGALWNRGRRIWFAPLTAALFRTKVFGALGLLDESFESYLEDVELGLRCALAGYSGLYVPEARAVHTGSATLGRWHPDTVRRIARNQILLIAKHYPRDWIAQYGWPVLVGQALWGGVAARHGAGLAWLQGVREGVGSFAKLRGAGTEWKRLETVFKETEQELRELQHATGMDTFWRLYFALT
jgi:GT2 family glycosyltransferase